MITKAKANEIRRRSERLEKWITDNGYRDKTGWASYPSDKVPKKCRVGNTELSALEVYEWMTSPPDKYFLYVSEDNATATTWMGDKLGAVTFGKPYSSPGFGGFGSQRVPVRVKGINGVEYYGTYYKSSGDYARVKRCN